ncbi:MAG: hypothetical protein JST79_00115 [Acidobacteria bacterium]|jgi:hypothetical protein|nr:hypothetical protein [Acidobacteriota bacterium]
MRVLKERGIFAHPIVSIEYQQLAQRYVLRGLESGGSVGDIGRYVTFADEEGRALEYLHPVEAIGVNGLHAVVICQAFLRVDMLRKDATYETLLTRHWLNLAEAGRRPAMETEILFRGIHGRLELDLRGKDKAQAGRVVPVFYSLAGEPVSIPAKFLPVLRAATKAVNCRNCSHRHYLRKPVSRPLNAGAGPTTETAGGDASLAVAQSSEA